MFERFTEPAASRSLPADVDREAAIKDEHRSSQRDIEIMREDWGSADVDREFWLIAREVWSLQFAISNGRTEGLQCG